MMLGIWNTLMRFVGRREVLEDGPPKVRSMWNE